MNQKIINWTEKVQKEYKVYPRFVLEVGSLNVNGTVKHLFEHSENYIGIDFREGKDVDIVLNAHDMQKVPGFGKFDAMVCMNMLEHDDNPMVTLAQIKRGLVPGGFLLFAMPTIDFPIHDHPGDYWRLTEEGVRDIVFQGFELLNMETIYTKTNDAGKPINGVICAVGKKK